MAPQYLSEYVPPQNRAAVNLRARPPLYQIFARTDRYRTSFFPFCATEWNKLDSRIRDIPSISRFKRAMFDFLRPKGESNFKVTNNQGMVLLTRLRVGFSHLKEHKFRHNFSDSVDPFCNCRDNSIENTEHFLLQCSNYSNERLLMLDGLRDFDINLIPLNPFSISRILFLVIQVLIQN